MKRLLLAPLLLTLLVGCSSKDKSYIERRDDCADVYGRVITLDEFIKKYNLGLSNDPPLTSKSRKQAATTYFCNFYRNQTAE